MFLSSFSGYLSAQDYNNSLWERGHKLLLVFRALTSLTDELRANLELH